MNRIAASLLAAAAAGATLVAMAAARDDERAKPRRPHVVIVVADDLGYADLGFTGSRDIPTPNLDALAAGGVVCTDGHVSASVCAPSRAGLITGRYQQRFGFEFNLQNQPSGIDTQRTFAEALRDTGYETVAIGKWHLGQSDETHPLAVGFDHFTGLIGGSRTYFPIEGKVSKARRIERDGEIVSESEIEYVTDFLSAEAVRRIHGREPDKPLFLYLSYTAPHSPNHGRPDLLARFAESIPDEKRRTYAAMVAALDEGIGDVTRALREEGMLENTLLVFLSDNGGATTNWSDNGPWRGMKGSKWEGGQRVPFVVHWPAALPPGNYDAPVISLDLLPTALAAAGAPMPATDSPLDGVDLVPYLRGESEERPHDVLFWRRGPAAAVREGSWKLIRITEEDGSLRSPMLVDLSEYPDETVNQAAEHPDRVAHLSALLETFERDCREPSWKTGDRWQRNQHYKHRMDVQGRAAERRFP